MNKIQIRNYITGNVIYEHEEDDNTIKKTVEAAVKENADLGGADLRGAYLRGAYLSGAYLRGADLIGAYLSGADLRGAYLRGADLSGADLRGADLIGAYLSGAYLSGADLRDAYLIGAYLSGADLSGAYLRDAYLTGAYLSGADLSGADLIGAYLRDAYLIGADLRGADLRGADLRDAYLGSAYLRDAKNIPFIPLACPSDGAFTGWKKVREEGISYLVELYIPTEARRNSATTNKCRCDKAKVISITRIDNGEEVNKVTNSGHTVTTYEVGCMVTPDSFDENRWRECSHGIHFFINKQEAINY